MQNCLNYRQLHTGKISGIFAAAKLVVAIWDHPREMIHTGNGRMKDGILTDTLVHLSSRGLKRCIAELHLTHYFTTVELDDGSVGACMSYYNLPDSILDAAERQIAVHCANDPFVMQDEATVTGIIENCVHDEKQRYFLATSVRATLASALSAPFIRDGGDEFFKVVARRPANWAYGAETALVVGFGGLLGPLISETTVKKIHALDLYYERRRDELEAKLSQYRNQHPEKTITISARLEHAGQLRDFDLLSITGSTLCNGTLEYFLANVRHDASVILQGQSASLHPKALFEAGVKWVATTLKPREVTMIARENHDGEALRPLLEGGLQWIYLVPRNDKNGAP